MSASAAGVQQPTPSEGTSRWPLLQPWQEKQGKCKCRQSCAPANTLAGKHPLAVFILPRELQGGHHLLRAEGPRKGAWKAPMAIPGKTALHLGGTPTNRHSGKGSVGIDPLGKPSGRCSRGGWAGESRHNKEKMNSSSSDRRLWGWWNFAPVATPWWCNSGQHGQRSPAVVPSPQLISYRDSAGEPHFSLPHHCTLGVR